MNLSPETRLALDPQVCLRNDVDRAVLVARPQPLGIRDQFTALVHPKDAIILSLFDGDRRIVDVKSLWRDLTDKSDEVAGREVDRIVNGFSSMGRRKANVFVEVAAENQDKIIRYDPKEFVIPRDRVDLKDLRLRKPYIVYFLPTLFCPQKCVYCYAKTCPTPEPEPIGLERLREIFQEVRSLGVEVIGLSGGDPLAHKGIDQILETIIEFGMIPDIPTKAGLSYERACKLKSLGVELLQVSVDSAEPQVLDRMVGVKGYHKRLFRLLEDLRRAGLKVRVNTVVTPINWPTLPGMIDYLGRLGHVQQVILTPYARSMFCHQEGLFIEPSVLEELRRQIAGKGEIYKHMKINLGSTSPPVPEDRAERRKQWEERAYCTANRIGFVILPDGRATVCEELYDHPSYIIGDLKRQSVMEVWNSPKALSLIHPDQRAVPDGPCKRCKKFVECNAERGRCWRDVLKAYGWERPHYPDPRCPAAPGRIRLG